MSRFARRFDRSTVPSHRVAAGLFVLSLLLCAVPGAAGEGDRGAAGMQTRSVAIVVYDGVEVLDFAGPAEVLEAANAFTVRDTPAFELYTVGATAEPITSQGFLEVVPDHPVESAPLPDVLVVPGGRTNPVRENPGFLEWIGRAAEEAEVVMSVCSGAFVLGQLGLLDGREVTTWYGAVPGLARRFPEARVRPGMRFVDSGEVITTAGVSAGIDGALHLVARFHGRHVADGTARYMEYDWAPEAYLAQDYPLLDPGVGAGRWSLQLAEIQSDDGNLDAAVELYRSAIDRGVASARSWYGLGSALHRAGDPQGAIEAYTRVPRGTDSSHAHRALYNAACIAASEGETDRSLALLEAAVDAGFPSRSWMEADPDLEPVRADPRFAELLDRLE